MSIPRIVNIPNNNSFIMFGPRQTGKSTLLGERFSAAHTMSYNLLRRTDFVRLQTNPDLLFDDCRHRPATMTHVLIDEIQKIPELLDVVQAILIEPWAPIFVLSGYSARKLKRSGANLLAGRVWTRSLHPFTHIELGSSFDLKRALQRGTLPPVYLAESDDVAAEYLAAYVATYLTEEIQQEAQIRSIGPFSRLLLHAAGGMGTPLNYSSFSRQTMTSDKTVKEYFRILEDTLVGFFLLPYGGSVRKKLSQHPKFYLFDTGVALAAQGSERISLQAGTPLFGALFELWIINEIRRLLAYWQQSSVQLSFLRADEKTEVDLILEGNERPTLSIEIKSSSDVPYGEVRNGVELAREIIPGAMHHVICTTTRRREHNGVTFWPWQEFFEWWGQEWVVRNKAS